MEPRFKLHYSKFCALGRRPEFKQWLQGTSSELYNYLQSGSIGCKARSERMVFIYNKLYESGKGAAFESFIMDKFPYIIDRGSDIKPVLDPHKHLDAKKGTIRAKPIMPPRANVEGLNKHKVFRVYKPDILSFPQKRIIVNENREQLEAQVSHFCQDKFGTDFIIVEDRAYIEYFEPRHKALADKVPKEKRDIFIYRKGQK